MSIHHDCFVKVRDKGEKFLCFLKANILTGTGTKRMKTGLKQKNIFPKSFNKNADWCLH